jgi:hypothetical protein
MARTPRGRGGGGLILAGLAAVVFLAVKPGGALASAPAHGGTLGCSGLEQLWESEGGSSGAASTAASVAMAESSGQASATNVNTNGSTDRGYWQINSIWGAQSTYDPAANARAAVQISHDGTDFSPWTTYTSGAYAGRC